MHSAIGIQHQLGIESSKLRWSLARSESAAFRTWLFASRSHAVQFAWVSIWTPLCCLELDSHLSQHQPPKCPTGRVWGTVLSQVPPAPPNHGARRVSELCGAWVHRDLESKDHLIPAKWIMASLSFSHSYDLFCSLRVSQVMLSA